MTKEKDIYQKLLNTLKKSQPGPVNREGFKEGLMERIREMDEKDSSASMPNLLDLLFGWVENKWLRWSVSTVAFCLLIVFTLQQTGLNMRISKLEKQLIQYESESLKNRGADFGHRVFYKLYTNADQDSITVSRDDLEKLLQEYQTLKDGSKEQEPVLKDSDATYKL